MRLRKENDFFIFAAAVEQKRGALKKVLIEKSPKTNIGLL